MVLAQKKEKGTPWMQFSYSGRFEADPEGGFLVTFPDVPEAITHGADQAEALANASDALGLALRGYLAEGRPLPRPSARRKGLIEVPLETTDALKIAVIEAFGAARISKSEFARRLGKGETEAYRILDPDHATKVPALENALAVLGKRVVVSVLDAA